MLSRKQQKRAYMFPDSVLTQRALYEWLNVLPPEEVLFFLCFFLSLDNIEEIVSRLGWGQKKAQAIKTRCTEDYHRWDRGIVFTL